MSKNIQDDRGGKKHDDFTHIRERPDMYIGSVVCERSNQYIFIDAPINFDDDDGVEIEIEDDDSTTKKTLIPKIQQRPMNHNQGLERIIIEIESNIIDNKWRSDAEGIPMKTIKFSLDKEKGMITLYNDGYHIPITKYKYSERNRVTGKMEEFEAYPAEVFFSDTKAGTNFNTSTGKKKYVKTSGRNGIGSKGTNALSKTFIVEHSDPENSKKFYQEYRCSSTVDKNGNNVYNFTKDKPTITSYKNKTPYTQISFIPDYEYFGYIKEDDETNEDEISIEEYGMDSNLYNFIKKCAYDCSLLSYLPVTFNEEKIHVKSLKDYAKLYYPNSKMVDLNFTTTSGKKSVDYKGTCDVNEIVLVELPEDAGYELIQDNVKNISFVNGIYTRNGGKHVEAWKDAIFGGLVKAYNSGGKVKTASKSKGKSKAKSTKVSKDTKPKATSKHIYPYFCLFVRSECGEHDVKFESQNKNELTSPEIELFDKNDKDIKETVTTDITNLLSKVLKWEFVKILDDRLSILDDKRLMVKDKQSFNSLNIDKLDDANWAGKKNAAECSLVITEGDSAKALVTTAIKQKQLHDTFGVYPIRGKFKNAEKFTYKELQSNEEVNNIIKIIGLRMGVDYSIEENFKELRYGKGIMIMSDADDDGIHIRGLLLNFIYKLWPSLIQRKFVCSKSMPVVEVTWAGGNEMTFYSNEAYEAWQQCICNKHNLTSNDQIKSVLRGYEANYYKGLGSYDAKDAGYYFAMDKNLVFTESLASGVDRLYMDLGFKKDAADFRKRWITQDMLRPDDECRAVITHGRHLRNLFGTIDYNIPDTVTKNNEEEIINDDEIEIEDDGDGEIEIEIEEEECTIKKCVQDYKKSTIVTRDDILNSIRSKTITDKEYNEEKFDVQSRGEMYLSVFVDKSLKIFHRATFARALPNYIDHFKNGQRKIFYTLLKMNSKGKDELTAVIGRVKEYASYHHGESSIYGAIVCMGNNIVGYGNNLSFIIPRGQFGDRDNYIESAASPRYLALEVRDLTRKIFLPIDDNLLTKNYDNGKQIEYEFYLPILPVILANGAEGMAVGFSTKIPSYNPLDLVDRLILLLQRYDDIENNDVDDEYDTAFDDREYLTPWYWRHDGEIEMIPPKEDKVGYNYTGWISKGILKKDDGTIKVETGEGKKIKKDQFKGWWHITELPIGMKTKDFKGWLTYLKNGVPPKDKKWKKGEKYIMDYQEYHPPEKVHFIIKPTKEFTPDINVNGNMKNLQSRNSLENMVVIDQNFYPRKYKNPEDIILDFFKFRIQFYQKRKDYILKNKNDELKEMQNRQKYIEYIVIKKTLDLYKYETKELLYAQMQKLGLMKLPNSKGLMTYDYLLDMTTKSLTKEKFVKLNDKIKSLIDFINKTKTTKITNMWREDLKDFKVSYDKFLKEREKELFDVERSKRRKRQQ
jgi:DNA gyrase/topoisomerase IV subunit B